MKHLKTLLAALALTCAGGAWAQTDVTSTYIQNADFSSTEGWTEYVSSQYKDFGNGLIGTYGVRTAEGQGVSTVDETHLATEYCFGFECRWNTNFASYNQTLVNLPVGAYKLTFDVENTNGSTKEATYNNLFYVQVGETKYTDASTEWMNGKSSWTTHTISFVLDEASDATISLGYGTGSNNFGSANTPTLHVSHLKLTWSDPLDALKADLAEAKEEALALLNDENYNNVTGEARTNLQAEYDKATPSTKEDLETAIEDINKAIDAFKAAPLIAANAALVEGASASTPVVTPFVVNGTFTDNVNGWSRTGGFQNNAKASNQQGDFTVPFWENWNGSARENKMYQDINYIPNGTYKLKIAAFVNTLADPNESQYVFANNDKVFLTTGAPTFYEVWTVVTTNAIQIGLEQTTATANWMGIDNVTLTYYGEGDVIEEAKLHAPKLNLKEKIDAAQAIVDANTGALFDKTADAVSALETAISEATSTYNTSSSIDELNQAIEDLNAAITTYNSAAVNTPDADKVYAVKNASSTNEKTLYLGLNKGNVTLVANKQALKFEATDGGYYLTDGEQYVGYAGTNTWSMSAAADKKDVLHITLVDGKYTIELSKRAGKIVGTDDFVDGGFCYADKGTGNNGYWTIEEVEAAAETALNEDETYAAAGTYADVTLARTINAGWNAVVLPFAVKAADFEGAIFATYAGDETVDDVLNLKFTSVDEVAANTPFLFYAPADMTSFTFEGILVNTQHDAAGTAFDFVGFYGAKTSPIVAGDYILTGGNVQKAKGGNAIKAYRAYFKANGTAPAKAAQFVVDGDVVTGINAAALVSNENNAAVYNLNGVRVSGNLQKGVYIQNGKKVVVK